MVARGLRGAGCSRMPTCMTLAVSTGMLSCGTSVITWSSVSEHGYPKLSAGRTVPPAYRPSWKRTVMGGSLVEPREMQGEAIRVS